jgi:hypothetical protein
MDSLGQSDSCRSVCIVIVTRWTAWVTHLAWTNARRCLYQGQPGSPTSRGLMPDAAYTSEHVLTYADLRCGGLWEQAVREGQYSYKYSYSVIQRRGTIRHSDTGRFGTAINARAARLCVHLRARLCQRLPTLWRTVRADSASRQ